MGIALFGNKSAIRQRLVTTTVTYTAILSLLFAFFVVGFQTRGLLIAFGKARESYGHMG